MSVIRTREQAPRLTGPARAPARAGAASAGAGMSPKDVLRIIRKRKWLIGIVWAAAAGLVIAGTFVWEKTLPFYTVRALLTVQADEPALLTIQRAPMYTKEIMERLKRSKAALVLQQSVLELAVKDPQITRTDWYKANEDDPKRALAEDVDVGPISDTNFISISMTSIRPGDESADIVNALAKHFIDTVSEKSKRRRTQEMRRLKAQRDALLSTLDRVRRERAAAIGSSPIAAMQERRSIVTIKLQMLVQSMAEATEIQTEARAALKVYEDDIRAGRIEHNFDIKRYLDMDPTLRQFEMQVYELRSRLNNASRTLGVDHRTVKQLASLGESIDSEAKARRAELIEESVQVIRQLRQMAEQVATQQLVALTERYDEARAEAKDLEVTLGRIQALTQEADYVAENIRQLGQNLLALELQQRETGDVGTVSWGASARPPLAPSHPKWELMIPLAVVLGMVLGFGLAFLLELADTSIKGPGDIARRFDLPMLGMVPHSDDLDEEVEDFRRVVLLAPHSPASESFRQIRTNLLFSGPAHQRRSLMITSPAPEDGRTTVVLNLAASMAQSGRRVLVVDANFRQPAMSEMFPQAPAEGLSSALVGQAAWRDVVCETDVPNLSVIAAGPLPPNPAELLGSDVLRQLISEMTAEYDQVIFDSSPVMVVADSCILSTQVDGTILVVRAGINSSGLVQRATDQLTRIGAHVIGVVLQGVKTTAGGYLRKNYRTFYEYQQKPLP